MGSDELAEGEAGAEAMASDAAHEGRWAADQKPGLRRFLWFAGLLTLAYGWTLVSLVVHALGRDLHSHILLIPLVSASLIYSDRQRLPGTCGCSPAWAPLFAIPGLASLVVALAIGVGDNALSHNDFLVLTVFSFLCFLAAGGFAFLGRRWMAAVAFPAAFLIFMLPLPDAVVIGFENFLMAASADAADLLFSISGTPYVRDGQVIQLSAITLEVAQECSGIRSSYVLFITSLLASYVILRSPWRRILLVAVVIPLGIVRNGFRVLVIGLLCVHYGPHMIDSIVHKKGGPFFFALSLIPLFLLLWILRKSEAPNEDEAAAEMG